MLPKCDTLRSSFILSLFDLKKRDDAYWSSNRHVELFFTVIRDEPQLIVLEGFRGRCHT